MKEIKKSGFVVSIKKNGTEFCMFMTSCEDASELLSTIVDTAVEYGENGDFEVAIRREGCE